MTLFGTRRREPAPVPDPAQKAETCTACGTVGEGAHQIPVPEYGMQWVCVNPAQCRQRAQLAGVYGNPAGGAW